MWKAGLALAAGGLAGLTAEAILLDQCIRTPGPMTVTTMMPGLVYASAAVAKVCLVAGLVLAVAVRRAEGPAPVWGLAALAVATVVPVLGGAVAVAVQIGTGEMDGGGISRSGVLAMLGGIGVGAGLAGVSLFRRERPGSMGWIALAMYGVMAGLFVWQRFYVPWFDQDRWAG